MPVSRGAEPGAGLRTEPGTEQWNRATGHSPRSQPGPSQGRDVPQDGSHRPPAWLLLGFGCDLGPQPLPQLLPLSFPRNRRAAISENVQPPRKTARITRWASPAGLSSPALSGRATVLWDLQPQVPPRSQAPHPAPALPETENSLPLSSRTTSSRPCQPRRSSTFGTGCRLGSMERGTDPHPNAPPWDPHRSRGWGHVLFPGLTCSMILQLRGM